MNSYKRRRLVREGVREDSVAPSRLATIDETSELVDLEVVSDGKLPLTPEVRDFPLSPLSNDYYDALDDEDDEEDADDVEEEEEESEEDSICTYGDYFENLAPTLRSEVTPFPGDDHLAERPKIKDSPSIREQIGIAAGVSDHEFLTFLPIPHS